MVLLEARISAYGTEAAGVLRRRRRGSELHPRRERVHISQSGVSAQIRQLERDLGATLIDRSGRTATLTPAGAAALEQRQAVLASVAAMRRAVDDVTGLIRGRIAVGMVTACTVTPLFDALAAFHRAHPGVEIALSEDNSDRLVEGVRSGDPRPRPGRGGGRTARGSGLDHHRQRAAGRGGPRRSSVGRKQRQATLADVCAHPIVCLPAGTGIRTVFDRRLLGGRHSAEHRAAGQRRPGAVADLAAGGLASPS